MRFLSVAAILAGASMAAAAQTPAAVPQTGAPWDYSGKTGPLNWGRLDPAYKACSEGHEQSPVDIRGAHLNKGLTPIEFRTLSGPIRLQNTGKSIIGHASPGSYIVVDGVRYTLHQFHFHYPSETTVKGKHTDMEVHIVHASAEGKVVVLAVRLTLEHGDPNAVMAALWPHLPTQAHQVVMVTEPINPRGLIPADQSYWSYMGSQTYPPCTEGMRWIVYQSALSISPNQFRSFKAILPMNARPTQDLHGRRIEANE